MKELEVSKASFLLYLKKGHYSLNYRMEKTRVMRVEVWKMGRRPCISYAAGRLPQTLEEDSTERIGTLLLKFPEVCEANS